jgi:hypothetical protein
MKTEEHNTINILFWDIWDSLCACVRSATYIGLNFSPFLTHKHTALQETSDVLTFGVVEGDTGCYKCTPTLKAEILTNAMEQSPWKAHSSSANRENPLHYHVHTCHFLVLILSQFKPVYAFFIIFFQINLILFSHLRLGFTSSFFLQAFHDGPLCISLLSHACCTCQIAL